MILRIWGRDKKMLIFQKKKIEKSRKRFLRLIIRFVGFFDVFLHKCNVLKKQVSFYLY